MGSDSKIEWTHHTFNPWIGCNKISPGCKFCYAEELMDKRYGKAKWGIHGTRTGTSEDYWKQPFKWNRKAEREGVRARVFCASLADAMEDREGLQPIREDLYGIIEATPFLDWLFLTKRPENYIQFLPKHWLAYPRPNVWLGTSVEDQERANERIPHLLNTPAVCRLLSMEPLLEKVNLRQMFRKNGGEWDVLRGIDTKIQCHLLGKIHWVIAGGESGRNARPMHPSWVRSIRDQCEEAGVPFFFKQWGEWLPYESYANTSFWATPDGRLHDGHALNILDPETGEEGKDWDAGFWCEGQLSGCAFRKVGKAKAGRLLDGKEYSQFPIIRG